MKPQRWLAAFDVHGDMQDPSAVAEFHRFRREWKPSIRIAGGDIHDFRWLREKAGEEERREDIEADFDAGNQFLADFRPTVFIEGNHDWRLRKAAEKCSIGSQRRLFQALLDERATALKGNPLFLPYDKRLGVYRLGDVAVIHGFTEGINAIRRAAQSYGNVLMGHIHASMADILPTFPKPVRAYSSACLALLDLGYNNRTLGTLREQNGFTYGVVLPNGYTTVNQVIREDGRWIYPGMAE
jgi:hypothetical protein